MFMKNMKTEKEFFLNFYLKMMLKNLKSQIELSVQNLSNYMFVAQDLKGDCTLLKIHSKK